MSSNPVESIDHVTGVTLQLAGHFASPAINRFLDDELDEMRWLLVDYVGIALAGSLTETGRISGDFAERLGGAPEATIIGRATKVPAVHAAFANAVSEHSLELDDIDEEAYFHYGPPVVSAALAAGQMVRAPGRQVLAAVLAGCEMMHRLSRATNPSLRDRGFHTTPTCGVFGAAVAAGRLLALDAEGMTNALGLAGAQASGLMEMYGPSMQKRINPGPAARDGITAAVLASMGFTGSETIIEGERGFARAYCDAFDENKLTERLGEGSGVEIEYKAYSAARPIHAAIDGALEIRGRNEISIDEIEEIRVGRSPAWAQYHAISRPRSYHEAQVSLPYSVAVALCDGAALPEQYSDERISSDERLMSLAGRVTIHEDSTLPSSLSCRTIVVGKHGQTFEAVVDHPKGSLSNPLSQGERIEKFERLAGERLSAESVGNLGDLLMSFEQVKDINELLLVCSA